MMHDRPQAQLVQATIVDMIFQPAARYPADPRAVFILVFAAFSGLLGLALQQAPGSLGRTLPTIVVATWGIILTLGSILTLIGMARQTLDGILMEQVGSVATGVAAIFYAAIALRVVGGDALYPAGIIFGWGFACLARWLQLQVLLVRTRREAMITNAVNQAIQELEPGDE